MDYKELIEQLEDIVNYGDERPAEYCTNRCGGCDACDKSIDAIDAIETLLAELDAAVELLRRGKKRCLACIYNGRSIHDFPCNSCKETRGMSDYWEWRGPQKGEESAGTAGRAAGMTRWAASVGTRPAPTKLDRSRWDGCDSCENQKIKQLLLNHGRKYCSVCGRHLTEEAWAELEKKLEV